MCSTDREQPDWRGHKDAPLIPDALWPRIGWLIGLLGVLTAVFALLTAGSETAHPFEEEIIYLLRDPSVPTSLWDFGIVLGSAAFFVTVVVLLAVWAIARRSWPALVACATVPGAVVIVEQILKPIVDRRYVWGNDELYYPSGTAAGVAAWTTLTWLLAVPLIHRRGLRVALAIGLGALTALTAVSIVGADKHFPFDAIGGVTTGMGVVLACAALIDLVTGVHRAPDPTPDPDPADADSFRGAKPSL